MTEVTVLVCDDEPLVREGLRAFVERDGRLRWLGEARSGHEAVALVRQRRPDLLLLDIQMPELDGFGVLESLGPDVPPAVVFITAFDAYAIRAFDVHAVDYLLKPFEEERFTLAITRALTRLRDPEHPRGDGWRAARDDVRAGATRVRRLLVKDDGRIAVVPVDDIDWIEAADNYVKLHTAGKTWMVRESMRDIEQQLEGSGFARVHRSAIVNLARVRELQPLFGGEYCVVLTSGQRLTLSRGFRDAFRNRLTGES